MKKKSKKSKNKKNKEDTGEDIIPLKEGWEKIMSGGVYPFFERVEEVDEKKELGATSIPLNQYVDTYDTIFTMCIQREPYNYSAPLYLKHNEALVEYYTNKFLPALTSSKEQHGLFFLKEWCKRWRCNMWAVDGMTRMFMYLDRFHVPNSEELLSTSEKGYTIYMDNVFKMFKSTARECILSCISGERDGEEQDRELLKASIDVFVELGCKLKKVEMTIYRDDFHKYLVADTTQYYATKSRFWLDQLSCPEYLIQASKCVEAEESRLNSYIDKFSVNGLMQATREQLLAEHQKELLAKDTGIDRMLERTNGVGHDATEAKQDLQRLYHLYEQVPNGLKPIATFMKNHICKLGNEYIEKSKKEEKKKPEKKEQKSETKKSEKSNDMAGHQALISKLIDLHHRFLTIVKVQFNHDNVFQKALKDAFEDFINKEYYTSTYLAKYSNDILKKGNKIAVADLETTMDHVVMLYGYIRDKDMFERDYQQFLAGRLLQDLSESEQSERSMIGKLKTESGYHWTSKLEDMFKDIQLSKEIISEYNKFKIDDEEGKSLQTNEIDLNVSICTTGAWPTQSGQPIKKPQILAKICDHFTKFYVNKHSGRKLTFQMNKGKAEVQVQFNPKVKKILVCTTYQMIVLLLFNNKVTYTFKEVIEETGIARTDLIIAILSMVHPKVKVMRKAPGGKGIQDDHKLQINPKYSNPRHQIAIPVLNSVVAKPANDHTNDMESIIKLRKHQMDAAIVRIMKARKALAHPALVSEVVKQLCQRFTPKPSDIKKRIISLIDLDYLERDENDRQLYHYKM